MSIFRVLCIITLCYYVTPYPSLCFSVSLLICCCVDLYPSLHSSIFLCIYLPRSLCFLSIIFWVRILQSAIVSFCLCVDSSTSWWKSVSLPLYLCQSFIFISSDLNNFQYASQFLYFYVSVLTHILHFITKYWCISLLILWYVDVCICHCVDPSLCGSISFDPFLCWFFTVLTPIIN